MKKKKLSPKKSTAPPRALTTFLILPTLQFWSGPRPARSPPHIPTDGLSVGCTPDRARGPLSAFRKIHLYGKTKKSTHGHQTAKPFCTHFFKSAYTDYFDQGK